MAEIPVMRDDRFRATCQGALNIEIVPRIVQEGSEAKPRLHQKSLRANRIQHQVDLAAADPGIGPENAGPVQDVFVFKNDCRARRECDVTRQHPSKHDMGRSVP